MSLQFRYVYLFPLIILYSFSSAQDHTVGDSTLTVRNNDIDPTGLVPGDSILFLGDINVQPAGPPRPGVRISPVPSGLTLVFDTLSTTSTTSNARAGIHVNGPFDGNFVHRGTTQGGAGVIFDGDFTGSFSNSGILRGRNDGAAFFGNLDGSFLNSGLIRGRFVDGVYIQDNLSQTFVNTGSIISRREDGVDIDGRMSGIFINRGLIRGRGEEGVEIERNLFGTLINFGVIEGADNGILIERNLVGSILNYLTIEGGDDGIDIDGDINSGEGITNFGNIVGGDDGIDVDGQVRSNSEITNRGTIEGSDSGIDINGSLRGDINNFGTILGGSVGVEIGNVFSGEIFNCGIIEGTGGFGIRVLTSSTGTIRNHGGRIQGDGTAIRLNAGGSTVILSGPSHIIGEINGGSGSDILRFENMRGISPAKQAELAALATADPASGTVTLFGEEIAWRRIADVQADAATLVSYSSLINGPGLQNYAASLDNVQGLNDSFRNFLKGLNDAAPALLNEISSNASGQGILNGLNDFSREQDTRVYSLFSSHFSTLRGDVAGGGGFGSAQAGVERTGLLTREVQAGGTWEIDEPAYTTFAIGYVGSGDQDPTAQRAGSDFDATTILFGRGTHISETLYLGAFGGYGHNQAETDRFGSVLDSRVIYTGLNAQYVSGAFFTNVLAGYGFHDTKSIRRDFIGNEMTGDQDGHQGLLYAQVGMDYCFGEENKAQVTPYIGTALSSVHHEGFNERGPSGTSLRIQDDTVNSFQSVVGIDVSGFKDTSFGWLQPRISAAWWHAFDQENSYQVSLVTPGLLDPFTVSTTSSSQNRAVVQLGGEFGIGSIENWTFNVGYSGVFGEDYSSHGGTFGGKIEF